MRRIFYTGRCDTLVLNLAEDCDLQKCRGRQDNASALLSAAETLPARYTRDDESTMRTIEFICEGPRQVNIFGLWAVQTCQGPTYSEVLVQLTTEPKADQ